MSYRRLAGSCEDGPCGTFFVDDVTGHVIVQGYTTVEQPVAAPPGEGFLFIPAEQWRALPTQLPRR